MAGFGSDSSLRASSSQLSRSPGGCGAGHYCPDNPNTRGERAVFLVKTIGLLLYGP